MFDTYVQSRQPVHNTTTINEHRAPTDQSVALLKEFEEKARNKVVESIRLADNGFECVIHKERSHMTGDTEYVVIFKLNGKQMEARHIQRDFPQKEVHETLIAIRDAVSLVIANHIANAFTQVESRFGRS